MYWVETNPAVISNAAEGVRSLFQPDSLAGAQFYARRSSGGRLDPERKLFLAVLQDALRCYQENVVARNAKKLRLFEDAEEWIFTDNPGWLFSFGTVCEALGLDPSYLRRGLLQWKRSKVKALARSRRKKKNKQSSMRVRRRGLKAR